MGVLAMVNLVALTMLFPTGMRLHNDYERQINAGVDDPVFDIDRFKDLDLDRAAWEGVKSGR